MSVENTHYGADRLRQMLRDCRRIWFIGIGGVSMYSLARLTMKEGLAVGGSDRTESHLTRALAAEGAKICIGHAAEQIRDYDAVVYTVAIGGDNPEYLAAKESGVPCVSRADYLGYLMTRYPVRIGIAGMHGKSTTTAMCAELLLAVGDPTVLCGAELPSLDGSTCHVGDRTAPILFEACEYMDSFLDFSPTLAVVLNIAMDHVDYFHSMEQIRTSFLRFAERTGEGGELLYNADDPESVRALAPFRGRHHTFAIHAPAEFTAEEIRVSEGRTHFVLCREGKPLTEIAMRSFGLHNVYNALAAAAAALLTGMPPSRIAPAMDRFVGPHRRMEYKGGCNRADVYDDYGHHPDEIRATLKGARAMGYRRILCAYQPHTYSRTAGLFEEFCEAFADADRVFLADVYAAREQNLWGVSMPAMAERIGPRAFYCGDFASVAEAIRAEAGEGDLVIVMGAGDIWHVFEHLNL